MQKLLGIIVINLLLSSSVYGEVVIKKYLIKKFDVYSTKVLCLKNIPDNKMMNAQNILEQWLDNDNDKKPNNILVVN